MDGKIYVTKQGEMWDYIAWKVYGDESYVSVLYEANPIFNDVYIFDAGCEIICPETLLNTDEDENEGQPDWRDDEDLEADDLGTDDSGDDMEDDGDL